MGSLDAIESEGLSAYWDGFAGSSNPYTRKTPESRAWAMGWMKGRREEKKMFGSNCVPIEEKSPHQSRWRL